MATGKKADGTAGNNAQLVSTLKSLECPDSTFGGFVPPLVLAEGSGSIVKDSEGQSYIDLCAGFGTAVLGHNPKALRNVFSRQAQSGFVPVLQGMGDVYASEAKVRLLELLAENLPDHLNQGALSVTGSQAVEMAVRTAHLATGRPLVLAFEGGYHGTDLGVLPYTHSAKFKTRFASMVGDQAVFMPYGMAADQIEDKLNELGVALTDISAVLVEPIQGRGGTILPPAGWLQSLAEKAKSWGSLVIFDEVFTGMGRAGQFCLAEREPCDIICIGKGLGGGMPISACFARSEVMAAWPESTGEAMHTGTFFGHPFTCAAAAAVVEQIVSLELPARSRALGERSRDYLASKLPQWQVRGQGLMLVMAGEAGSGVDLMNRLRTTGVHSLVSGPAGECLAITPALTIPEDLLFEAYDRIIATANDLG